MRPFIKATIGLFTMFTVELSQAQRVLEAALAKSAEIGVPMNVAIVDQGGNLTSFARQDGAWLGSIDIAIKKARTARYFDMESGAIGEISQPGGPLFNIEVSNGGLISFPGGIPLRAGDTVIGAVGVSGGTIDQDRTVALAGVQAL